MSMRLGSWILTAALVVLGGWLAYGALADNNHPAYAASGTTLLAGQTDDTPDAAPAPPQTTPSPSPGSTADAGSAVPAPFASAATGGAPSESSNSNSNSSSNSNSNSSSTGTSAGNSALVDTAWAARVAAATGIPYRAVLGYAGATIALQREHSACHLGWSTLAALGDIESGHGTHAGSRLDDNGVDTPGVFGPALDGSAYDAIAANPSAANADVAGSGAAAPDASASSWARAAGPLQFIPSTWAEWGADGSGDGTADPQQIDDAALAAGRYLCSYGDLSSAAGWRASIFAYNHVQSYVDSVAAAANAYAAEVR
ncbi:hypothetical protein BH09ACT6_BH09ACT6_24980 [soil metagenome]